MSPGGPTPEEASLSSLALPFRGAELIYGVYVLVVLFFFELDVEILAEVDLVVRTPQAG